MALNGRDDVAWYEMILSGWRDCVSLASGLYYGALFTIVRPPAFLLSLILFLWRHRIALND